MAIPAKVLPGFSASLFMQSAATPTPLTTANLSVWTAQVAAIVGTSANGTGVNGVFVAPTDHYSSREAEHDAQEQQVL